MITYLDDLSRTPLKLKEDPLPWQKRGLRETMSGYGKKLTTSRKVFFEGRWYRVYCCIYSNAGSCYIVKGGRALYLRYDHYDCEDSQ